MRPTCPALPYFCCRLCCLRHLSFPIPLLSRCRYFSSVRRIRRRRQCKTACELSS